ncbi:uncharacterized protein BP5553_10692 [Venustampulla echinocandica]|uniref:Uncharacterized protein n=1 Tax=Venustampulla echinocandica TaxID=2656787 RepID=A0A370T8M7_9HELO|nr:uncharacterized protein BP5553_10692 [Venustampulla echinocandica]RDL29712.1 hypothetical protein BP5553_10692 [Venustampulla echinocandica]
MTTEYAPASHPLTILDWKLAQKTGDPLSRLLSVHESLDPADPAWISLSSADHIRQQWHRVLQLQAKGHALPLFGVPFAVKDNIDATGLATTAACPDFSYSPAEDASVVRIIKAAGAVLMGKTNLDAFATGLVGVRSPYGAVPNTFNDKYVSGGSSSGSASVVARGLVPFSLGTDTAGSGRVPAGFNNIVGLKPTRGALSTTGVVPACRTLDCVSIFALVVEDAKLVFDIAAKYDPDDSFSRPVIRNPPMSIPSRPRIAICDSPPWFGGDRQHHDSYHQALEGATALGWDIQPNDFSLLFKLSSFLYEGPWVAERLAAIKTFIQRPDAGIDPTVRGIIKDASKFSAVDFFTAEYSRRDLALAVENQFQHYDAILVPTTPTFPTIEQVHQEPLLENSRLGTFTNFVNLLDWSAISVPAGLRSDGLPFGLTIISTRWQEEKLCQLGAQFSASMPRKLGATNCKSQDLPMSSLVETETSPSTSQLVIVGAHLSGFPLNYQLKDSGATFNRTAKTSPLYRLYELSSPAHAIRKPGLKRIAGGSTMLGSSIDVEIWDIPSETLGKFMAFIPPPLAIGSVEMSDGSWVKGFVCEPWGLDDAMDITASGGWRAHMATEAGKKNKISPQKTNGHQLHEILVEA